jgi:hypothetical protein
MCLQSLSIVTSVSGGFRVLAYRKYATQLPSAGSSPEPDGISPQIHKCFPKIHFNIVRYRGDSRRGFGLANGFMDHLYTRLGTTSNYRVTDDLHNSEITTAPAKTFPACCVFTNRSLETASNGGKSSASRAQVPSSQTPVQNCLTTDIDKAETLCFQQQLYCCVRLRSCGSVFTKPLPRNVRCLQSHCSATGLYVTILSSVLEYVWMCDWFFPLRYYSKNSNSTSRLCKQTWALSINVCKIVFCINIKLHGTRSYTEGRNFLPANVKEQKRTERNM